MIVDGGEVVAKIVKVIICGARVVVMVGCGLRKVCKKVEACGIKG